MKGVRSISILTNYTERIRWNPDFFSGRVIPEESPSGRLFSPA
jgi:hypothetical protein